jgi:class 3 adenylate cyclase
MARDLPSGTVTFLFTDIEGSTRLLKQLGDRYAEILAEHQRLLRAAFEAAGGQEIDTQGDSFFFVFSRAKDALAAAVEGQRALAEHAWPRGAKVRVRMGLHSGEPAPLGEERYVGMGVHKAARIASAAHGGQILLSRATRELVADDLPPRVRIVDLGEQQLKDFDRPEHVFQLDAPRLAHRFPPLRTDAALPAARPRRPALSRQRALIAAASALVIAGIVIGLALAMGRHEAKVDSGASTATRGQGPFTAPGKDPDEILIGRSIGAVELGMSEAEVKARYGPGRQSQWHRRGRGGDRILYTGEQGSLTVSFYDGKVAQIATSSPYYSTDNGVHAGVRAPNLVDPTVVEGALARHEIERVAPGVYAWKDFIWASSDRSYCLRDDRSATQLAFGGGVSQHITVVSITDSRLLDYLPVTVVEAVGIVSELYCHGEPLQP